MFPDNINRVHFIGVAGSGMAALALASHLRGIKVTGSDIRPSSYVQALLAVGVPVNFGHDAAAINDPELELVVVSTAIPADNPELLAAHARGLDVWPRARMLAWLGADRRMLAVSGTHGKTTTSAMLACALVELGADPTFLVGGVVRSTKTNARLGDGEYFVVEADESDGSFTYLDPLLAIITNIEAEHLDHFANLAEVRLAFRAFLAKLRPDGIAVVCADDAELVALARENERQVLTYGLINDADVRLIRADDTADGASFSVRFADGQMLRLGLPSAPGVHNMLNATAALAALDWLGFKRQAAARALHAFAGVHRRFDIVGKTGGVTVIDDYAHHPTEVAATLKAARDAGFSQIHVLFQPHRYSRTQAFMEQFATAFDAATTLSLMPIYAAGERPRVGITSAALAEKIGRNCRATRVHLLDDRDEIPAWMLSLVRSGDCILCMGAGDVTQEAPRIYQELEHAERTLRPEAPAASYAAGPPGKEG
jgi:UDP-N-acetylmuramate--alanine ligase